MTSLPQTQVFPTSLEEMEGLLHALEASADSVLAFDGQNFRDHEAQLFLESSAVQFLATWTGSLNGRLRISPRENEPPVDALKRMSDTLPGALIGMLDEQAWIEMPKAALAKFKDAFFKQQRSWPDLDAQDQAALICQDNIPAGIGLPPQLYPAAKAGAVADRDHFRLLVDQLIASVTDEANIRGAISSRREQLTTILHELFKNTHDHARLTTDGKPLSFSIRGTYARFYSSAQLEYTGAAPQKDEQGRDILSGLDQAERFASYFTRDRVQQHNRLIQAEERQFLGLLELSVFDTGPGFAATYLKKKFGGASVQQQFEAVLGCFATGRSTTGDESRGYGLWKVLRDLRELKGFIRVRTNKVHVYRDFAWYENMFLQEKKGGATAPEERMMDWRRGITRRITEGYPDMQGAHVAVLIPLGEHL
ncbi:hypothetical protein [Herbaspirillum autotrophicum]|uniref:hypothetical protein n=1 Tax=Herbaspirillum autotrophicum TaxID=180195 RepID=UPI001E4D8BE9|nr:hypothetical protein [Herbaspirillum autotrophicum]